jgi:hypothetical protein
MKNDLVEIASFPTANEVDILESIFQSEGIEYIIEDVNSATIIPGVDVRILVRDEDALRAIHLVKSSGYENYLTDLE